MLRTSAPSSLLRAAAPGSPFCVPLTLEAVTPSRDAITGARVLRSASGRTFPVREDIAIFVNPGGIESAQLSQQCFYDRLAPLYDFLSALHMVFSPQARTWREEYLRELQVRPGARVLEVSVGTGANLVRLPPADYFGLDVSWQMLRRCRRKRRRGSSVTLCQGLAEQLPFQSDAFDVVFHVGAINFFADKARALAEMVRVARPGTRLTVVDSTEIFVRRYGNTPILRSVYARSAGLHRPPVEFLPAGVEEVRLREFAAGELYCLTFRKAAV